jgi:hypothetical protein
MRTIRAFPAVLVILSLPAALVLAPLPEILAAQLPEDEDRGVLVESVERDPAGGAEGLGVLKRFDVVTHAGRAAVSSPEELVTALSSAPPGGGGVECSGRA